MRKLYEIRVELIKYKNNLREINRLMSSKPSKILVDNKEKIKQKIKDLEKELETVKDKGSEK
jgi:hypothetical protein